MNQSTGFDLVDSVLAELERDTRVDLHHADIQLEVADYGVRISGQVPDIAGKRIAASVTRQLAGDETRVEDRLYVETPAVPDRELGTKASERLMAEPAFAETGIALEVAGRTDTLQQPPASGHTIQMGVEHGAVSLRGRVPSLTHQRLAEVLLWWTAGCRRVDNALAVDPPQGDSDEVLNDALRMVLEKDPLIDAGQVHAGSTAGIVELEGQLPSAELHRLAVRDVWAVPGVWDVDDHLRVE